jgi:hypothetical protein
VKLGAPVGMSQMRRPAIGALGTAVLSVLVAASAAHADKATSAAANEQATVEFAAGRFDEAIAAWQRAFAESPAPEYLHNIAQAYRRRGDCRNAIVYFERFLGAQPHAANRAAVERRIIELNASCAQPSAGSPPSADAQPLDGAAPDAGPRVAAAGATAPAAPIGTIVHTAPPSDQPTRPFIAMQGGASFLSMTDLYVPAVATLRLRGAGSFGTRWRWEPGIAVALSPVRYNETSAGTAWLTSVLATMGTSYAITPMVRIRAELGAGAQVFSGLEQGNPFTAGLQAASAIWLPTSRVGVAAEVAIGRVQIGLAPALSITSARAPLRENIGVFTQFDVLGSVGVRL